MLTFELPDGVFNCRVAGLLWRDQTVLLQKDPAEEFWVLPGGRLEFGEPSNQAVRREFLEEIGVRVHTDRLLWVVENFFGEAPAFHELALYYQVSADEALPAEETFLGQASDHDPPLHFRWVPLDQLHTLRVYPSFLDAAFRAPAPFTQHVIVRD